MTNAAMNNEIFDSAQNFFEKTQCIYDLLKTLPADAQLAVRLDGRIEAQLGFKENSVYFQEGFPADPDLEFTISAETLRRWIHQPPQEVTALALSFISEVTLGHSKVSHWKSLSALKSKGYGEAFKRLTPQVQGELMQKGFLALATAQNAAQLGLQTAKALAQSFLASRFNKK